jgi:hypothetical protein
VSRSLRHYLNLRRSIVPPRTSPCSLSERGLIGLVFGTLSVDYVTAGLATMIATLSLAILCISTGVALARPTFAAALSVHAPRQRQGIIMGAIQSLVAVTDIVTPVPRASFPDRSFRGHGSA